jgi:hypothetical protein
MPANILIGFAAVYAAFYYLVARSALQDIERVDPAFYEWLGASHATSPNNSRAIVELMFDGRCPKDFYPVGAKRKLLAARLMFYLSPLIFIAVLVFL